MNEQILGLELLETEAQPRLARAKFDLGTGIVLKILIDQRPLIRYQKGPQMSPQISFGSPEKLNQIHALETLSTYASRGPWR